jgi:hypothetical protein
VPALEDEVTESPTIEPGQIWRIAVPSGETRPFTSECKSIAAADAVICEGALAAIGAAHRPLGSYVEPAS